MDNSILNTIKKLLGIDENDHSFDLDIITHINSTFPLLAQLGVGSEAGYMIEDASTEWGEYLRGDQRLMSVITYIAARVKLWFDPPETSFAIEAQERQISELGWRLSITPSMVPVVVVEVV